MAENHDADIDKVMVGDYCIGCGACAYGEEALSMEFDARGLLQPSGEIHDPRRATAVCPFAATRDEDAIGAELFADGSEYDPRVGYFRRILVGHVEDGEIRDRGGSSGFVTWLTQRLLVQGSIDGVIHVGASPNGGGRLFEYRVSRSGEEILGSAKSRYYPVHFADVLKQVRDDERSYALVGVPCFVKAVRLLTDHDPVLRSQIKYCIALFCGHLKSAAYAEFVAGQLGVAPADLNGIDFRVKDPSMPANRYRMAVSGRRHSGAVRRELSNFRFYGTDWGLGYFKPKACDWCDDIVGETADVSSGDAWLPEYVGDPRGNNIVIVRSAGLDRLIVEAMARGELHFGETSVDAVYESQAGNYRHRREGLSVRLRDANRSGVWHPIKRIRPDDHEVSARRERTYRMRSRLSYLSHRRFRAAGKDPLAFGFAMLYDELRYYRLTSHVGRRMIRSLYRLGALAVRKLRTKVME